MVTRKDSNKERLKRHKRVRGKVSGTAARPRLSVFRSLQHIYAQLIDDEKQVTLAAASTVEKEFGGYGGNIGAAKKVGGMIAARAKELGVESAVFDRGGNIYHGRVQALAEAAREGGLQF
jgi:large subunit ribosomal protein L18